MLKELDTEVRCNACGNVPDRIIGFAYRGRAFSALVSCPCGATQQRRLIHHADVTTHDDRIVYRLWFGYREVIEYTAPLGTRRAASPAAGGASCLRGAVEALHDHEV
jgi:hypothetical protein